jgi:hypothetical protein
VCFGLVTLATAADVQHREATAIAAKPEKVDEKHWVMPIDVTASHCDEYPCGGGVDFTILFHFQKRPQAQGQDNSSVHFMLKDGNPQTRVTIDRYDKDLVVEEVRIRKVHCSSSLDLQ